MSESGISRDLPGGRGARGTCLALGRGAALAALAAQLAAILCFPASGRADSLPAALATSQPSNRALIITVSEYPRSPLPGVLTDHKLGLELARRFGVPEANIVDLSERDVTRDGLKSAIDGLAGSLQPGDRVFVYYSGHGARFFDPVTQQCEEGIVMQDMHVVPKSEFSKLIKPLSAKADKTLVMLDSCHAGGVAQAAGSRSLGARLQRPKFSRDASSPQCNQVVNGGSFSQSRGIEMATTDNNLVVLAAARKNEAAWDTSKGGALTFNFAECLDGAAVDTDHSGSVSMNELAACVQARLDKTQDESMRQHVTLAGNGSLVPAFAPASIPAGAMPAGAMPAGAGPASLAAPVAALPAPVDTLATLQDIYAQRDDRWTVALGLDQPALKIGSNLGMSVRSARDGFVYIFYRGSQPDSFYLLFPNALDTANAIAADQDLPLPRKDWTVTALGPSGTDTLLVLVTDMPRDFSALALPAEYVSKAGPFEKIKPTPSAAARIAQIAAMPSAVGGCGAASRDAGVVPSCSAAFGARMVSVEEIP